jgi:hypothetical protein
MGKIRSLFALFRKGRCISDPARWKARQIEASALVAFIWAAVQTASAFGVEIPIDGDTVDGIAVGLLAVVNWVLTVITTDKVGLPDEPGADGG